MRKPIASRPPTSAGGAHLAAAVGGGVEGIRTLSRGGDGSGGEGGGEPPPPVPGFTPVAGESPEETMLRRAQAISA